MPIRFPQPYRGQPRPKYPKPQKQVRDLQKEKDLDTTQTGLFIILAIASLIIGTTYRYKDSNMFLFGIIGFLLFCVLAGATFDGAKRINRFRSGYDTDTSSWEKDGEEEEDQQE